MRHERAFHLALAQTQVEIAEGYGVGVNRQHKLPQNHEKQRRTEQAEPANGLASCACGSRQDDQAARQEAVKEMPRNR